MPTQKRATRPASIAFRLDRIDSMRCEDASATAAVAAAVVAARIADTALQLYRVRQKGNWVLRDFAYCYELRCHALRDTIAKFDQIA